MFFVNGHFCNSTIVGWTYWQCVFFLNASHETIPRRSLANSLATYLHPPVWSSPMCLMVWLPSQRCQPQDRVETTGSIWKSEPHIYIYTRSIFYILYIMIYIYITNNNSNKNSNNSMNKYHKIILYTDSIYFHISSFKRSWYMMICNLLSPNLHYNYDSITCFFCWFMWVVERPNMPTLEDGVRSWPTWLSARSPRNRPQEVLRMLETLDSRCWPLLTRLRKPKSLMPKSLTEDLRWWPSSACFSRRG